MNVLLKCGHRSIHKDHPFCPICANGRVIKDLAGSVIRTVTPADARAVLSPAPNLGIRRARCISCGKVVSSDKATLMFEYRPYADQDFFYCGCKGS